MLHAGEHSFRPNRVEFGKLAFDLELVLVVGGDK